jgi:glycerol-3-phosphate dehydrogenase (NAD(P)+)
VDQSDITGKTLVCCAKGIDRATGKLPAELLASILGRSGGATRIAALSGPSFAADVANGLPTALTIASKSMAVSNRLAILLSSPRFRCYASTDLKGVELGGALKNVIAIAVGAVRGMGLGASAEAALVARGFAEMARLASALGADSATLTGLSGLGDLVLTCSHSQSRNFAYGMALGRSEPLENRPLAEGAFTAAIASDIAIANGIDTPIITAVSQVLARIITTREAVTQLLDRPLKREMEQDVNSGDNE